MRIEIKSETTAYQLQQLGMPTPGWEPIEYTPELQARIEAELAESEARASLYEQMSIKINSLDTITNKTLRELLIALQIDPNSPQIGYLLESTKSLLAVRYFQLYKGQAGLSETMAAIVRGDFFESES